MVGRFEYLWVCRILFLCLHVPFCPYLQRWNIGPLFYQLFSGFPFFSPKLFWLFSNLEFWLTHSHLFKLSSEILNRRRKSSSQFLAYTFSSESTLELLKLSILITILQPQYFSLIPYNNQKNLMPLARNINLLHPVLLREKLFKELK